MEYKHFSHEHNLTLYRVQQGQQFQCNGCHLQCQKDSIFACWSCSFFLHEHCGNANRYVKHPAHPAHPLVLMATPTYCSSSFLCNCCGMPGTSLSYCCPLCEIDLHVPCAYLPFKVSVNSHPHQLSLAVGSQEKVGPTQYCKICSKEVSHKYWRYYCDKDECDFRVHTFCGTSEVNPGQYVDDEPDAAVQVSAPTNQPSAEDVLAEMFQIQMQLQMAQQLNQMFAPAKN